MESGALRILAGLERTEAGAIPPRPRSTGRPSSSCGELIASHSRKRRAAPCPEKRGLPSRA